MSRILRGGMNGALVGDMLTTVGNKVDEDYRMFDEAGYNVTCNHEPLNKQI